MTRLSRGLLERAITQLNCFWREFREQSAQVTWRELIKPIVQNDWHLRSVASDDACAVGALTSLLSQLFLAEYDLLCATVLAFE